jgi:hypothetical protein
MFLRLRNSRQSGVFSVPSQGLLCHDVSPLTLLCLACCQSTAINTWITQGWGGVTWPPRVPWWRHAFLQWCNCRRALFFHMSDQGFIGETEARLRVALKSVLGGRQLQKVHSWRRSDHVIRSDRFQLSEGVQSSRLRVQLISEVKWSE